MLNVGYCINTAPIQLYIWQRLNSIWRFGSSISLPLSVKSYQWAFGMGHSWPSVLGGPGVSVQTSLGQVILCVSIIKTILTLPVPVCLLVGSMCVDQCVHVNLIPS